MKKKLCMILVIILLLISFPSVAFSASVTQRSYSINLQMPIEETHYISGDIYLKLHGDSGETAFWNVTDVHAAQNGLLQTAGSLSYVIKDRDVGKIKKVQIAYYALNNEDNSWKLDYFELDKVTYQVKATLTAEGGYPCVLDVELNDSKNSQCKTDRYLVIQGREYDKRPDVSYDKTYSFKIKTGKNSAAGMDGVVHFQLVGVDGESDWLTITETDENGNNVFEPNSEDEFFITGQRNLGKLKEIRVQTKSSVSTDGGWLLESIGVEQQTPCPVNRWIQNKDYISISLDTPSNVMIIKTDIKAAASVLSMPDLVIIVGGSLIILTTAVFAAFMIKRKHQKNLI